MTPGRDRVLCAALTTIAAAVVYVQIGQMTGDPVTFAVGHLIAMAAVFAVSSMWAPALGKIKR